MSRENVALAYRYGAAANARKVPQGLLAPDFVMVNAETAVTDKTYEGAAGVIEWTGDMFEAFASGARFEIERVVAEGDDFVVSVCRIGGTGARSGAPLLLRWAAVFWFRDGKLARLVGYVSRREALKAVGLEAHLLP
jgi:ketosteroid isomerase-like protein